MKTLNTKKFEYAAIIANERLFPAVGKNRKSIIVTGLTDFTMTKTLNDAVSLLYVTIFLLSTCRKFTILHLCCTTAPYVRHWSIVAAAATDAAAIIDSVVCDWVSFSRVFQGKLYFSSTLKVKYLRNERVEDFKEHQNENIQQKKGW